MGGILAGEAGIEPATRRLTVVGSAAELLAKIIAVFFLMVIRCAYGIRTLISPLQKGCSTIELYAAIWFAYFDRS